MSRFLLGASLCVLLFGAPGVDAKTPEWVITAEREALLRDALGADAPLAGVVLKAAAIEKAQVVLSYGAAGVEAPQATVTLVHPSAATEAATRLTHLAIEPTPGPAPAALVEALAKRLEAAQGLDALWTLLEAPPEEPAKPEEPKGDKAPDPKAAAVEALRMTYARGDEVSAKALAAELNTITVADPNLRLKAVIVLAKLGLKDELLAVSKTFTGTWENVGRALRGELSDPGVLLQESDAKAACERADLAEALIAGGHAKTAEALYGAILAVNPSCHPAGIGLALQHLANDAPQAAIDLLLPWHERDQQDEQINTALSSAYRHLGDLDSAIRHFHFTADKRAQDPQARFLGLLNALYLKANNEAYWAEHWREVLKTRPDHYVGRFLLGACLHYLDEFEESNVHLDQLVGLLDHEPRLYVYRAMNRFNLGQVKEARALLDEAAKLPAVDPDVYYCIGEVSRDTERDVAIENLGRYLTLTARSFYSNPSKHARVTTMRDNLVACDRDGIAVCEGPWEHPRPVLTRALWRNKALMDWTVLFLALGLIALIVRLVRRKRRA
ncbi:MAG: tetratricopeptide repeat protein [Myxococcota bacterium]